MLRPSGARTITEYKSCLPVAALSQKCANVLHRARCSNQWIQAGIVQGSSPVLTLAGLSLFALG